MTIFTRLTLVLILFASFSAAPAAFAVGGITNPGNPGITNPSNPPQTTQTRQTQTPGESTALMNPLGSGSSVSSFIANILGLVTRIGSIFVVLMLVYVGFLFVNARGEPGELQKARQALLYTLVGALILLGAQALAAGIQATTQALSG